MYRRLLVVVGFLVFTCLLYSFRQSGTETLTNKDIIDKMIFANDKVVTLKYRLKKKERIEGKYLLGEQVVKYQRNPRKVYTKILAPNKGVEVLYVEGQNNKKAYVNPNAFPYITLSLDPRGSTMRNNNHHTVYEVGFDYVTSIVESISDKSGNDFNKYFIHNGDTVFNGKPCYKVLIDYTPFSYVNYTVKAGETLPVIADKLLVSDYMILTLNPTIDDYNDVKAGQVIKVPTAYARKTVLYIEKTTFLPLVQRMYDDKGLFAQYEFYDVQLNPTISQEEFTKGYKDYDF